MTSLRAFVIVVLVLAVGGSSLADDNDKGKPPQPPGKCINSGTFAFSGITFPRGPTAKLGEPNALEILIKRQGLEESPPGHCGFRSVGVSVSASLGGAAPVKTQITTAYPSVTAKLEIPAAMVVAGASLVVTLSDVNGLRKEVVLKPVAQTYAIPPL